MDSKNFLPHQPCPFARDRPANRMQGRGQAAALALVAGALCGIALIFDVVHRHTELMDGIDSSFSQLAGGSGYKAISTNSVSLEGKVDQMIKKAKAIKSDLYNLEADFKAAAPRQLTSRRRTATWKWRSCYKSSKIR